MGKEGYDYIQIALMRKEMFVYLIEEIRLGVSWIHFIDGIYLFSVILMFIMRIFASHILSYFWQGILISVFTSKFTTCLNKWVFAVCGCCFSFINLSSDTFSAVTKNYLMILVYSSSSFQNENCKLRLLLYSQANLSKISFGNETEIADREEIQNYIQNDFGNSG